MEKVGYVLAICDDDGMFIDYTEGIFTSYEDAFRRQKELNAEAPKHYRRPFYEEGYGEDYWPESDEVLNQAYKNDDVDTVEKELNKHIVTDVDTICTILNDEYYEGAVPFGWYQVIAMDVH